MGEEICDGTFTLVITFSSFISSVLVRLTFQYLRLIDGAEKH